MQKRLNGPTATPSMPPKTKPLLPQLLLPTPCKVSFSIHQMTPILTSRQWHPCLHNVNGTSSLPVDPRSTSKVNTLPSTSFLSRGAPLVHVPLEHTSHHDPALMQHNRLADDRQHHSTSCRMTHHNTVAPTCLPSTCTFRLCPTLAAHHASTLNQRLIAHTTNFSRTSYLDVEPTVDCCPHTTNCSPKCRRMPFQLSATPCTRPSTLLIVGHSSTVFWN
jgi:hypothetical protein